jgi:hypothetical protein
MFFVVGRVFNTRLFAGSHQLSLVNHGPTSQTGATEQRLFAGFVTRT